MDYTDNNSKKNNNNESNNNIDNNIDNNNNNCSTSPLLRRVRVPPSESRYKQCKCKCLMYPSDTYLVCASNNSNHSNQCQQRMQRLRLECGNKIFNKNLIYFIYNYRKRKGEAKESNPPRDTDTFTVSDTDTYVSCVHCTYKRSTRYARTHKPRLSPVLFAQRDLAATLPGSCSCKLCKYL